MMVNCFDKKYNINLSVFFIFTFGDKQVARVQNRDPTDVKSSFNTSRERKVSTHGRQSH